MMVAPWLESAAWLGNVSHLVKGDHVAPPRVFKSHLPYGVRLVHPRRAPAPSVVVPLPPCRGAHADTTAGVSLPRCPL